MSRRKRKKKLKQDGKVVAQVIVETDVVSNGVEIVEIQDEIESLETVEAAVPEPKELISEAVVPPAKRGNAAGAKPRPGSDRRVHPRYAFTAAIEVVAAEPSVRIKTRVRDLSQRGCYVDTDRPLALGIVADIRISKNRQSFGARARVVYTQPGKGMGLVFTVVEPGQTQILDTWIVETRETSWLASSRRRSQRVLMRIPVRVSGQVGPETPIDEETHTVAISAHGAMITLAAPVYRGQRFRVLNVQTNEALECDVVYIEKVAGQQVQVGLEFLLPNPSFWRVAFPPKDWTPRHPDAKGK